MQEGLASVLYALKFEVLQLVHALRYFLGQLESFLMVLKLFGEESKCVDSHLLHMQACRIMDSTNLIQPLSVVSEDLFELGSQVVILRVLLYRLLEVDTVCFLLRVHLLLEGLDLLR